jgi:hypothetical protein
MTTLSAGEAVSVSMYVSRGKKNSGIWAWIGLNFEGYRNTTAVKLTSLFCRILSFLHTSAATEF